MPALSIYVMKAGQACKYDNGDWQATIWDAHFEAMYPGKPASITNGYGLVTLPPGRYVIRATKMNTGIHTNYAIATVCCEQSCVHLFVDAPRERPQPDDDGGECKITINKERVLGIGSSAPRTVRVAGSATKCKEVVVEVGGPNGSKTHTTVKVGTQGDWTADVSVEGLGLRCGGAITVNVWCAEHRHCSDRFRGDLRCVESP